MDAAADRPPDPLAAWLAATEGAATTPPPEGSDRDTDSGSRGRSVRPRLVLVVALPWVAAAALGATALHQAPTAPPLARSGGTDVATAAAATPSAPAVMPTPDAVDDRLAAAAVLTLRLSLPDEQYLDTAVAEQVTRLDGAVVVTVAAVVLDRVDGRWSAPRHVRFAVPLSVGQSEPVALGAPWVLSANPRQEAEPSATPIDDAALATATVQALRDAGYRDIAAPDLRRHAALPDILAVQVDARAPGEPAARTHEIWLDATASRVIGSAAASAPVQLPAPVPAETP